jgi:hypothetical protein
LEAGSRADGLGAAAFTQPSRTALSANRNGNKYIGIQQVALFFFSQKNTEKKGNKQSTEIENYRNAASHANKHTHQVGRDAENIDNNPPNLNIARKQHQQHTIIYTAVLPCHSTATSCVLLYIFG